MASPFAVFRRNQRVMMAVLGVVVILLFVVGDPLSRIIGGTSSPVNPVVVKTNYGNYRRSELDGLNYQRHLVSIFLERVVTARVRLDAAKSKIPEQQVQMFTRHAFMQLRMALLGRQHAPGDEATIETIVLSRRAEEMGMVASDRAVNELLQQVAGNALSQVPEIIASIKPDGRVPLSQTYLFDALQREILASKYAMMFQLGTIGTSPGERWNYFQQLNRKADAQVLPVKVTPFVQKVADPTPEELERYFEHYKNVLPQPNSPEPGFKQPLRIAFAYFKANVDRAAEKIAPEITDEQLHEYYEKNKAIQFREGHLPPMGMPGDTKTSTEDPLGPDEPAGEKPAKPVGDDQPSTDEAPSEKAPDDAAGGDSTPPAKPDTEPAKKSSQVEPGRVANPFRLASGGQKPAPARQPAKPTAPAKPAAAPPAKNSPAAGPPADAKSPAVDPLADPDSAETSGPGSAKTDGTGESAATGTDEAETTKSDSSEEKKEEPKYEPFEKVEDVIRQTLARDKVQAQLPKAFERLRAKVRAYHDARRTYLNKREHDPSATPPAELDLNALADENGVTAHTIDPVAAYEVEAEELGKSFSYVEEQGYRQVGFVQLAYLNPHEYVPTVTTDHEQNRYLWWETSIQPENVPALDSVRDEVVRAFKTKDARELALKQAETYAKQTRDAKKPLAEVFAGREGMSVTETGPFTRLSMGNTPYDPDMSQPRLSAVHAVDAPGSEFMDAVFNSSAGEVKVALNQPQNTAYVVQVQEFMPEVSTLEHEFMTEPFQKYAVVAVENQRALMDTWLATLERDAGVKWLEPAKADTRGEE